MNEKVNKFLLPEDKFMPEMHLRQPGFTYCAWALFTENKDMKKIKDTGDSKYIYQKELDKVYFQYDMAYGDFKDLNRRAFAVMKHLILLKIKNMMDIKEVLLQCFINSLIKKLLVKVLQMKTFLIKNCWKNYTSQLLENLIKGKYTHFL